MSADEVFVNSTFFDFCLYPVIRFRRWPLPAQGALDHLVSFRSGDLQNPTRHPHGKQAPLVGNDEHPQLQAGHLIQSFNHFVGLIEPLSVIQYYPTKSDFFLLEGIYPVAIAKLHVKRLAQVMTRILRKFLWPCLGIAAMPSPDSKSGPWKISSDTGISAKCSIVCQETPSGRTHREGRNLTPAG